MFPNAVLLGSATEKKRSKERLTEIQIVRELNREKRNKDKE